MSRQIDLTKPLSDEDKNYLLARNRTNDLYLAQQYADGVENPVPSPEATTIPSDSAPSTDTRTDAIDASAAGLDALQSPPSQQGATESASASPDYDDNYDDTDAWSYADLQSEIKTLNENLPEDSHTPANSSREVLIAALRKFDAENAAS